jgi:hypothetical protein
MSNNGPEDRALVRPVTRSEKYAALAYSLRSRADAPHVAGQRAELLAMAARFEALAREAEQEEVAEVKRLFETCAP